MTTAIAEPPWPENEPVREYLRDTPERARLSLALRTMATTPVEITPVIGGQPIRTGKTVRSVMPHAHAEVLGELHLASQDHALAAVSAARDAYPAWSELPWEARAAVFLKAAELLSERRRDRMLAATMLGQSKTSHQAEIDAACELADFFRFNVQFARRIFEDQPRSGKGTWNRADYRPLEGFVLAITPFNFTAIAGNLPTAPALLGNTVIWKPATTAMRSAFEIMRLLEEAGLPPGVINMLPGSAELGDVLVPHPDLAGIHFTGSTGTFRTLWRKAADNLDRYKSYPRIVGETGGKDFIVAHPSASVDRLCCAILRGGFEYQGQKCSAVSRVYVPRSLWPALREMLVDEAKTIKVGDVREFKNFMGAVIDARSFANIRGYIERAKSDPAATILAGGGCDDRTGYFVEPTLIEVTDPGHLLLREEIFGPVVTLFVYDDARWTETLDLVDKSTPYALTGAVFAADRHVLEDATRRLRHAAGNLYLNDKPTGAVVGQQPFGGGRASGTNDKAGSAMNLLRWLSPRIVKETFDPPRDYRYRFLDE